MQEVKLVADLCQNHLGDFELLIEMADKAVDAGATHVKLQHIYTKNLTFRPQFENGLVRNGRVLSIKRPWRKEYERLRPLELSFEENRKFAQYVTGRNAVPVSTCFARCDIPELKRAGFRTVKAASYDCPSYQLLRELADDFEEILVSTGSSFWDEITTASRVLKNKKTRHSFLHCVTIYPTPLRELNLGRLDRLRKLEPESVGFSDHTLAERDGILASKAAIAMGAGIIERHFTIIGRERTKDGPVSIGPGEISELRRFSRLEKSEQLKELFLLKKDWKGVFPGDPNRKLTEEELLNRDYYRGRFASPREKGNHDAAKMIFNWEETGV